MRPFIVLLAFLAAGISDLAQAQAASTRDERVRWAHVGPDVFPGAMPDTLRARLRDSLAAGRARWLEHRPAAYELAVGVGCFCPANGTTSHPQVIVRGRRIVGIRRIPQRQMSPEELVYWEVWTVDGLFDHAERELRDPRRASSQFTLDGQYGFPRLLVSVSPPISDSHWAVQVRRFKPLTQ